MEEDDDKEKESKNEKNKSKENDKKKENDEALDDHFSDGKASGFHSSLSQLNDTFLTFRRRETERGGGQGR